MLRDKGISELAKTTTRAKIDVLLDVLNSSEISKRESDKVVLALGKIQKEANDHAIELTIESVIENMKS